MILFDKQEFVVHQHQFAITVPHVNNWRFYTQQYKDLLVYLNRTGLKLNYQLNSKSYPYLFLLRHYCEIKLKSILDERGQQVSDTHNIDELITLFNDIPENLVSALQVINLDEQGTCFRYFYEKDRELTVLYKTDRVFLPFYEALAGLSPENFFYMDLGLVPPFEKRLPWELTFHFQPIDNTSQLRSTYDDLIAFIIKGVIDNQIEVNQIYLPLLFLLRHSVELALKDGLMDMVHALGEEQQKKIYRMISNEHKLEKIFNKYNQILPDNAPENLPVELGILYVQYKQQTEELKRNIHLLDSNSRYFRYPYSQTQHLHINRETLINIISGFLEVDAFMTFNIAVLKEYNIIPYSDREMEQMMGFSPDPW